MFHVCEDVGPRPAKGNLKADSGCWLGSIPKTHPTLFHTIPIGICGFGGFLCLGSEDGQRISGAEVVERLIRKPVTED